MKSKPKNDEYKKFESVLGSVLKTSHAELKEKLEKEKAAKTSAASSRASSDKD